MRIAKNNDLISTLTLGYNERVSGGMRAVNCLKVN